MTICLALAVFPAGMGAQQDIRRQQRQLDSLRQERAALERQMRELQSTAHDLASEISNLDRRADATARIVRTLDMQLRSIESEVAEATQNVARAEEELAQKRIVLRRRLVDIYKRGPTHTTEALLSAPSFGELVARYKYLHMLALRDRAVVRRVEQLRGQVALERDRLVTLQANLRDNREDRRVEEERLRALEQQQRRELTRTRRSVQQTETRLARIRQSEQQVASALAALEAARRRAEAARPATAPSRSSSIRSADYGRLAWPVDGPLLYRFGRAVQENNTSIRWNGIGIRAPAGSGVESIGAGTVVNVGQLGTYGLTVFVDHGGGDYTIYASLARADVRNGQSIVKGQTIGTVGISDPDLPPHLHFEVRRSRGTSTVTAIDPLTWLRRR